VPAKKKQRFTTLEDRVGSRVALDVDKVEAVWFAPVVPGYTPKRLIVQLPGGQIEVSEAEAAHVLGLLSVKREELEEEQEIA
jgi:hypothetical protein